MIEFENVVKRYGGAHDAINHLSLEIPRGSMVFLTGHSGAGKSTLLKLITAMERPTRGKLTINGIDVGNLQKWRIPYLRRRIGMIFQDHQLLNDRTVFDNVALPLVIEGYKGPEIETRVRAALNKIGLEGKEQLYPLALSGGEQQRVGIARAVVNKPPILLADEPTGNLDPELSETIMNLFTDFNNVGVTVLIATHDIDLVNRMGFPVVSLKNGQIARNDLIQHAEQS